MTYAVLLGLIGLCISAMALGPLLTPAQRAPVERRKRARLRRMVAAGWC